MEQIQHFFSNRFFSLHLLWYADLAQVELRVLYELVGTCFECKTDQSRWKRQSEGLLKDTKRESSKKRGLVVPVHCKVFPSWSVNRATCCVDNEKRNTLLEKTRLREHVCHEFHTY